MNWLLRVPEWVGWALLTTGAAMKTLIVVGLFAGWW